MDSKILNHGQSSGHHSSLFDSEEKSSSSSSSSKTKPKVMHEGNKPSSQFLRHGNIAEGSHIPVGVLVRKKWMVKNTGKTSWGAVYIRQVDGPAVGATAGSPHHRLNQTRRSKSRSRSRPRRLPGDISRTGASSNRGRCSATVCFWTSSQILHQQVILCRSSSNTSANHGINGNPW